MGRPKIDRRPVWDAYVKAHQATGISQVDWCGQQDPPIHPNKFSEWVKPYKAELTIKPSKTLMKAVIREVVREEAKSNKELVRAILDNASVPAANGLAANIYHENALIQQRAIEQTLDRTGHGTVKMTEPEPPKQAIPALFEGSEAASMAEIIGNEAQVSVNEGE